MEFRGLCTSFDLIKNPVANKENILNRDGPPNVLVNFDSNEDSADKKRINPLILRFFCGLRIL